MDMINTANISDKFINEFSEICKVKNFVDCEAHGKHIEATTLGNCVICRETINLKEIAIRKKLEGQKDASIPNFFKDASFDNYIPVHENAQILKSDLMRYNFDSNILLLGGTGRGKTHLGCALLNKAIEKGLKAFYVPFYRASNYKIHDKPLFAKMLIVDFLVIDEYGFQDTNFKKELLQEIIDERYLANTKDKFLATMIISNLKISPSIEDINNNVTTGFFADSITDATKSRLKENIYWFAKMQWDDYRIKKGVKSEN